MQKSRQDSAFAWERVAGWGRQYFVWVQDAARVEHILHQVHSLKHLRSFRERHVVSFLLSDSVLSTDATLSLADELHDKRIDKVV